MKLWFKQYRTGRPAHISTVIILTQFVACILSSCSTEPENSVPTAAFSISPESGNTSTEFQFDANACTDPEEESYQLQVRWDWESDGVWDTLWGNSKKREHKFAQSAVYTVTLVVRDSWGESDSITHEVQVLDTQIGY